MDRWVRLVYHFRVHTENPVVAEAGVDVIRHAGDRQRDLRHGQDLAEGLDLQRV
jgi:hypothetical protein